MARKGRNWWSYLFNQVHGSQPAVTKCDHAGGSCCLFLHNSTAWNFFWRFWQMKHLFRWGKRLQPFGSLGKAHILIASDMHEIISFFDGNLSSVVFFRKSKKNLPAQRPVHVQVQGNIFQCSVMCMCMCKRRSSSVRSSACASAAIKDLLAFRDVPVQVQEKIFQRSVMCLCKCKRRSEFKRKAT